FTEEDLEVLWQALVNMFDHDRSASRGLMAARHLFAFEHESPLGNAPAHKLFELIDVKRREVDGKEIETPRSYSDYIVTSVEEIASQLPHGVTVTDKVNP
ncbi:MAG: type I CRISPR-associated protein Cas7, partial [bacterium]